MVPHTFQRLVLEEHSLFQSEVLNGLLKGCWTMYHQNQRKRKSVHVSACVGTERKERGGGLGRNPDL